MISSFSGSASAPNLAATPEIPAPDAARRRPPSADKIHKFAITTAPPRMHPTATVIEANQARIAALTTTKMMFVRWIDQIVGIDHENIESRLPVLALKQSEFLDQPVEAGEDSEQEHHQRQPGVSAKVKIKVMPDNCARDHRPCELEADPGEPHHPAGA